MLARTQAVIKREVKVAGKSLTAHFRRITAGERHELLKGQKVNRANGATVSFELDLGLNEIQQQKFVLYSVVNEDGTPFFKNIEEVARVDAKLIGALYQTATGLEEEEEGDAKKS